MTWVWEVILAAPRSQETQKPVPLDEFEHGDGIRIIVPFDLTAPRSNKETPQSSEYGYRRRSSRAAARNPSRNNRLAVEGNHDRRFVPEIRVGLNRGHNLLCEAFKQVSKFG